MRSIRPYIALLILLASQAGLSANTLDAATAKRLAETGDHNTVARAINTCPPDPDSITKLRDALVAGYLPELRGDAERWEKSAGWVLTLHHKMVAAAENKNHWRRVMWQTELAQKTLFEALPRYHMAGDFVLLASPSDEQRRATDLLATRALAYLEQAEADQQRVLGALRKQPDYQIDYVDTERIKRMAEHLKLHVPYYRAWASLYVAAQQDTGPYFEKARDPAAKRDRLLQKAARDAAAAAKQQRSLENESRARLHLVTALIASARNRHDEALKQIDAAFSIEGVSKYTRLQLRLTHARVLADQGRTRAALAELDNLRADAFVRSNPFHVILVADRRFLIYRSAALAEIDPDKQAALLARAFAGYDDALRDPLMAEWRAPFEAFVQRRFADQIPRDIPASRWPTSVRLASIRQACNRAITHHQEGDIDTAESLFNEVVAHASALTSAPSLADTDRAEVGYLLGVAQIHLGRFTEAGSTLLAIAQEHPGHKRGEQAIVMAYLRVARPLHLSNPDSADASRFYELTLNTLLSRYPRIDQAAAALYDLPVFLHRAGRYAEAAEAYSRVPADHPVYAESIYERMKCAHAMWIDQRDDASAQLTIDTADRFFAEAQRVLAEADHENPMRQQRLTRYSVGALLTRAGVLLHHQRRIELAERAVDQVVSLVGDESEWQGRVLALRVTIHRERHDYAQATRHAIELTRIDPELGGGMSASLLKALGDHDKQLYKDSTAHPQLDQLANTALQLADRAALPWVADQQRLTESQRLVFALVPADCLYRAGRIEQALQRYESLEQQYPNTATKNLAVIEALAECRYRLGDYERARPGFEQMIRFAQARNRYDARYWQAQLRCYQMWDARLEGKTDPRLGRSIAVLLEISGNRNLTIAYRKPLEALRDKHLAPAE